MNLARLFPAFSSLDATDIERIAGKLKAKNFEKGSFLLVPGEVQREMYLIEQGVQMSFLETEKKIHVIAFTYPPGMSAIPESFLAQKPSENFLQALTDTKAYALSYSAMQELFSESRAIESLFRMLTEQTLIGLLKRHSEFYSRSMEERFRAFAQRSPHLFQLVPHKYIASYLNIDATNFSKLYNSIKF